MNDPRRVLMRFWIVLSPRSFLKNLREYATLGVMLVAGISWRERTALRVCPPDIEVNSDFHSNQIPHPRIKTDITRLFGKQKKMAALHHDPALTH